MAEDQLGPKSPLGVSMDHGILGMLKGIDTGAARRIRPGTKVADMPEGPPLVEIVDVCLPNP
jgi:hypothetical protein